MVTLFFFILAKKERTTCQFYDFSFCQLYQEKPLSYNIYIIVLKQIKPHAFTVYGQEITIFKNSCTAKSHNEPNKQEHIYLMF